MAAVPGSAGMPIVGDKSMEFYRDVIGFADKRIAQHKSRIFVSRLLNKPTVFVGSNSAVKELLNEHYSCMDLGYKAFMYQVYGDNILFSNGEEADTTRTTLKSLLTSHDSMHYFKQIIDRQTSKILSAITSGSTVAVYKLMKRLSTEICLSMFLGVNFEDSVDLADKIVALTTTHWHGIISVPVTVTVPGLSRSSYSKALEAKGHLLEIIKQKLKLNAEEFPQKMNKTEFLDSCHAANHLLLFTSAIVPKALASIMTSFILATCKQSQQTELLSDPELLECTLLEIQRLWPPLVGGRRLVRQTFTLSGLRVPQGHAVVFLTHHAHRDSAIFTDPDTFQPSRWLNKNRDDRDCLYVLGSGPRDCVGKHIVSLILTTVCKELLHEFTWESTDTGVHTYKWLPVTRPRDSIQVTFHRKKHASSLETASVRSQQDDEEQDEDDDVYCDCME